MQYPRMHPHRGPELGGVVAGKQIPGTLLAWRTHEQRNLLRRPPDDRMTNPHQSGWTAPTVGIIGGLGPEATLDFFRRVLEHTPAERDQDHLHLLIDNDPRVPDRNAAVAGTGPSPGPTLAEMARRLEAAGADFLVMPCNAAHAFADAITEAVSVPFLSIIEATADAVRARFPDARSVGVLASTGAIDAGLYQEALGARAVQVFVPEGDDRDAFMDVLYRVKTGDTSPAVRDAMREVARSLAKRGAEVLVAGCTEVPLVLDETDVDMPLVNSTDELVAATITRARLGMGGR
jgi:aspartate racemase